MNFKIFKVGILLTFLIPVSGFAQKDTVSFLVEGLCGMCKNRIEGTAMKIKGVELADWNIDTKLLTVQIGKGDFEEDLLHEAVSKVGHDTKKYKAPDGVYDKLPACCKYRDPNQMPAPHVDNASIEFFVNGVCGMCKHRIETAVNQIEGVKNADWNIETQILSVNVEHDVEADLLHRAVSEAGHDTKKITASDDTYNQLHACCKYRDPEVLAKFRPKTSKYPATISGRVWIEENGKKEPLEGVNLYWLNGKEVVATDKEGRFTFDRPEEANQLIASYVGFYSDTLILSKETMVNLTLTPGTMLETVNVTYRRKSIEVSFAEPILTQQIGRKELLKAACCTLAESFETNPAVDVSFTDAVTGTRQIEMLGLAGPYVQITRENLPDVRGLAAIYGLSYIPGPWIESIQLAKGPGSVVNGFESITGQLNVELKKPEEGERFYFNLYGNEGGRMEANINTRFKVGQKWHSGILLHGNWQPNQNDRNNDGFLEMPTGTDWTAINRWKYEGANGWSSQFGIKITNFDKTSGQLSFDGDQISLSEWGAKMQTNRVEGWAKVGKVFESRPNSSIGLQLSAVSHDQDAFFGWRSYLADQQSFYANLIYRETFNDQVHRLTSGISFQWDQFDETIGEMDFDRDERVPGAFIEYTFQPNNNFTAVGGLRGDHHNQYGFFLTPRLHLRYAFNENSVLRFSAGQGRRTASIVAENIGILASARRFNFPQGIFGVNKPYNLEQENAWNLGLNLRQTLILNDRELILTLDGYHTWFLQQSVLNFDVSARDLVFGNLDGKSFSNTLQAQIDYAVNSNLDLRIAYRFNEVRLDYSGIRTEDLVFEIIRLERPFVSRHRAFVNLAYETKSDWAFDLTFNWQGPKRIPTTRSSPVEFQLPERSPDFLITNTQVSKKFGEQLDLYLGAENLFNFVQKNPIISADDPFGSYFNASMIWGPVFGRMVYGGLRFTIE